MGNTDSTLSLSPSSSPPGPTTTIPSLQSLGDTDKQSNERLQTHISQDLPHHIFERKLTPTSGRFSSTYRIRHQDSGAVMLLKVVLLPIQTTQDSHAHGTHAHAHLQPQIQELSKLLTIQTQCHHLLSYTYSIGTPSFSVQNQNNTLYKPIYLLRPHTYSTLSQRIVTRPFLTNAEKMFIAHQIIDAVEYLHRKGVCHGHLTCDNVGLSSWNWVVLLDVLPGRPTFLAEDDPSDWIYYFQSRDEVMGGTGTNTSGIGGIGGGNAELYIQKNQIGGAGTDGNGGEKRCYLAPERFVKKKKKGDSLDAPSPGDGADLASVKSGQSGSHDTRASTSSANDVSGEEALTPAMDIFSLGCVLMELFLNGEPAMDLGDLMEYRQNANGITEHSTLPQRLNKIESGNMRAACRHMLHLDPKKRLSAGEYLKRLTTKETTTVAAGDGIHGADKKKGGSASGRTNDKKSGQSSGRNQAPPLPPCHTSVLLPLFQRVRCEVLSPDARIALAAIHYGKVIRETVGVEDKAGEEFFRRVVGPTMIGLYDKEGQDSETVQNEKDAEQIKSVRVGGSQSETSKECEEFRVKSPSSEFQLCDPFRKDGDLAYDELLAQTEKLLMEIENNRGTSTAVDGIKDEKKEEQRSSNTMNDDTANAFSTTSFRDLPQTPSSAALVIFVQFILSTIRHTQRPSSKLVGMQLLLRLAKFSTDGVRLQRIVPTVVSILNDSDACVRSTAVTVLTTVLAMIEHFPPSDAQAFPQYILKRVAHLVNDPVIMVRLAFVECMAQLAETALRFLDTCHAIKLYETVDGEGSMSDDDSSSKAMKQAMKSVESAFGNDAAKLLGSPEKDKPKTEEVSEKGRGKEKDENGVNDATSLIRDEYNKDLGELQEKFARWVVSVTTDISNHASALKQAILKDIARLCQFFGNEGVMTCILPQILAFLNHRKDWQLRASLCRHLPSVCAIVGRAATEQFVVPCVETALIDDEEVVVSSALHCLASLVQMGLLNRVVLLGNNLKYRSGDGRVSDQSNLGILEKYCALLVHPSDDIRHAASFLFATCFRTIGFPDDEVHIMPIMRPFLRYDVDRTRMLETEGIMSSLIPSLEESDFSGDADPDKFVDIGENRTDHEHLQSFNDSVKYYLSMSKRRQKRNQEGEWSDGLRILHDVIEEQEKASFSVYLPNQKYAELITKPLPEWYEQLRRIAYERKPFESEISALRTMSILSNVYALTILQPPHSVQPQKMWKGDFMTLDLGFENSLANDKEAGEEKLKSVLSSKESQAFTGASRGEWGSVSLVDPVSMEMSQFVSKLASVKAPVIPPRLGPLRDIDGRLYSSHAPARTLTQSAAPATARRIEWKPKVDVLSCSTSPHEHKGPVTRLAISQDQAFFVSASHDGTCKVYETQQIRDSSGGLKSCLTIGVEASGMPGESNTRVNDISIIENSHSVASGNSDGSIQIWRVDVISKEPQTKSATSAAMNSTTSSSRFSRVSGFKMLRKVEAHEGEISAVSHFNTNSASIVTFASQMCVHSWDLRCAEEPFALPSRPDFGYLSSMVVGNDRNWLVTGTNLGIVALWDIRFQKCVKAWQHNSRAPINRLGTSFASLSKADSPTPHVVIGCGLNETSIFDISSGSCRQCFRVLDPSLCYIERASLPSQCTALPSLNEIKLSSNLSRKLAGVNNAMESMMSSRVAPPQPNIQAFNGRVGSSGLNYLVTGGTDGFLRYWDFSSASKCFTISGLRNSQPRPVYESINCGSGRVTLCRQLQTPKTAEVSTTYLPKANQSGPVRPENRHRDAILDIKRLDYPMKGLISCSRDGVVKVWR